jgi:hypothetical protein
MQPSSATHSRRISARYIASSTARKKFFTSAVSLTVGQGAHYNHPRIRRVRGPRGWRGGRAAEGGGLLNRYRGLNPYRGFESHPLRHFAFTSGGRPGNRAAARGEACPLRHCPQRTASRDSFFVACAEPTRVVRVGNVRAVCPPTPAREIAGRRTPPSRRPAPSFPISLESWLRLSERRAASRESSRPEARRTPACWRG